MILYKKKLLVAVSGTDNVLSMGMSMSMSMAWDWLVGWVGLGWIGWGLSFKHRVLVKAAVLLKDP